jgi:SEC-C motif
MSGAGAGIARRLAASTGSGASGAGQETYQSEDAVSPKGRSRNEMHPCGSGKKHKRCCGVVSPPLRTLGLRLTVLTSAITRVE